jgi:hypothetical protein
MYRVRERGKASSPAFRLDERIGSERALKGVVITCNNRKFPAKQGFYTAVLIGGGSASERFSERPQGNLGLTTVRGSITVVELPGRIAL